MYRLTAATLACACALAAQATPVTYNIDPNHTYPAFEADHMGGVSIWRGKFTRTNGKIVYDAEAKTGSLEVSIDTSSIDFGHAKLEEQVRKENYLDVDKFPTATYNGKFTKFKGSTPTQIDGELTLHGVTRPVTLTIAQFLCKPHPMMKKEVCGADASASIDRKAFGVGPNDEKFGFKMDVKLLISVEAIRAD
jgi:polyisoprenoid-binding protein YceI